MRRRHYLASVAALLAGPLAGCAHPNAVLLMDEATDEEIAERASTDVDRDDEARRILSEILENGSATATEASPPVPTDRPAEYEGRYYALTVDETNRGERTRYGLVVELSPETPTPGGNAVEYETLPVVDREYLDAVVPPESGEDGGRDEHVVQWYSEAEIERSALLPDPEPDAVVYDGERYAIGVDEQTRTVSEYRYEAERVAGNASAYAASVRAEYAFTLSGLSDAEREIVAEAVDEGYYDGSADDAFSSLARRFREHEGLDTDEWGGYFLVRYEGTLYLADLQHPPSAVET